MILWVIFTCLWMHIDTATKSDKEHGEVTANQLHVVWPHSTVGLHDDVSVASSLRPFFDDDSGSFVNVTVQFGGSALLHCRVSELSDKTTVSWMKRQEGQLRLLSVGLDIYSSDSRYKVSWMKRQEGQLRLVSVGLDIYSSDSRYKVTLLEPNDWTLSVLEAQKTDEGLYECQVSSHPPLVHTLYLHVVVPELEIWDERGIPIRNKFYNAGSTIELKCSISKVPKPTHFILWKHGTVVLNYDVTRGGISVKTDMMVDGVKSRLYIANVGPQDSGNYTCFLQDVAETSVAVHVLNGETPAAMQHGGSSSHFPNPLRLPCLLTSLLVLKAR